jgi:hypothetical protein
VEEVAAIALMQRALSPRRAIAKLLALPGGGRCRGRRRTSATTPAGGSGTRGR